MPYWIHDNGETLGPMRAIDVLRRATPTTRVCDGETWFGLEDGADHEVAVGRDAPPAGRELASGERCSVRIRS